MTHGSLFSGQGGFDLASEWMGWENIFHCEINTFCQKILKYYWPQAALFTDITKTDFTPYEHTIDILTGGFPCQPYSVAGKRKGRDDERHLWPSMLRAIKEIKPRWIVGENVRGLINWDGGVVFDEVQTDLEAAGYEVIPFLLPACGVNAPHQRYRIWFVAYSHDIRAGNDSRTNGDRSAKNERWEGQPQFEFREISSNGIITDTGSKQLQERASLGDRQNTTEDRVGVDDRVERSSHFRHVTNTSSSRRIQDDIEHASSESEHARTSWLRFPTQSPLCSRDDGFSPKLDGITFPKWRAESIKAGGNAVVPQEVLQIFKAIEWHDLLY